MYASVSPALDPCFFKPAVDCPQWANHGGGIFSYSGAVQPTMPPGVYQTTVNSQGQVLFTMLPVITDDLIRLPDSVMDDLLLTMEKFWDSADAYAKFKQVFKRGILLFGSQGCGKTATLDLVFEGLLKRGGVVLVAGQPSVTTEALRQVREVEPDRHLIVLYEDIDSLFEEHGEQQVLSLLDGQLQVDKIVHIATTNYIDRIPSRLKNRPSRFDEVIEVKPPTDQHREMYLHHLLDGRGEVVDIPRFVKDTKGFSMAHIKELVVSVFVLGKRYEDVLTRLVGMMKENYEADTGFGFTSKKATGYKM